MLLDYNVCPLWNELQFKQRQFYKVVSKGSEEIRTGYGANIVW